MLVLTSLSQAVYTPSQAANVPLMGKELLLRCPEHKPLKGVCERLKAEGTRGERKEQLVRKERNMCRSCTS